MDSPTTHQCEYCGITIPTERFHDHPKACITALRKALLRQRQVAENLSYEISVRYLGVLEELAQNPGDQVGFFTINPDGTKIKHVPTQVAGIFAAILMRYRAACDWTPLYDARRRVDELEAENAELRRRAAPPPDPAGS